MTSTYLAAAETGPVAEATGILSLTWLLIALPLLGAAVLLLGGRRTDKYGHLIGTRHVGARLRHRASSSGSRCWGVTPRSARSGPTCSP